MDRTAREQVFERLYNESYDEMLKYMKGILLGPSGGL